MYQLELVFRLLVRLQFMYFQYNVYLSIVVRTNIYKYIYIYIYIYTPASWGVKTRTSVSCNPSHVVTRLIYIATAYVHACEVLYKQQAGLH